MIRGAVLGSPIAHSLSPTLHRAAFEYIGISGSYEAIDVPSGTLHNFFLAHESDFDYFLNTSLAARFYLIFLEDQVCYVIKKCQQNKFSIYTKDSND